MTPAEVDRYTRRRPLQPLDYRYDRYDRYSTVTPSTIQGPDHFPYVLRIYIFTLLPPSLPLLSGTLETRTYKSSYRRESYTGRPGLSILCHSIYLYYAFPVHTSGSARSRAVEGSLKLKVWLFEHSTFSVSAESAQPPPAVRRVVVFGCSLRIAALD